MAHDDPLQAVRGSRIEAFGGGPAPGCAPDPDKTRALLLGLIAEARAAERMPWPPVNAELYRMLFPQMTSCLPEDEGARLRLEFETELARLEAA
jgi:hypothetical protein